MFFLSDEMSLEISAMGDGDAAEITQECICFDEFITIKKLQKVPKESLYY